MSEKRKNRTILKTDETPSNVHVLPVENKNKIVKEETEEFVDFKTLASRLEDRISHIESTFKETLQALESDLQQTVKQSKIRRHEKDVQKDLTTLHDLLDHRVKKAINYLKDKEAKTKEDKSQLEMMKELTSRAIKVLSVDFYKDVINRLGFAEDEEEVDPFGMDRHLVERIKPLFDFMYYKYWRVETTGIDNIPDDGRALIVANHSGTVPYDGAMIKTAILNEHKTRKDARFLVENFVYHMPMMGSLMYRIGGVRACPENAQYLLNSGHLVVVFPEGVKGIGKFYNQRYNLQRFGRGGFIKLCMTTKSPLVPVGIVGAEEIHPIIFKSNVLAKMIGLPYIPITPTFPLLGLLGCVPLPTKWSIHFGKPMSFDKYEESALYDELLVHKLSEKVRSEIQNIIKDLLQKRGSVFFG